MTYANILLLSNPIQRDNNDANATLTEQRGGLEDDTFSKGSLGCKKKVLLFEDQVPDGVHLLLTWMEWVEMAFQASLDDALLHPHRRIFCLLDQPLNTQHIACISSFFDKILKDSFFRSPFSSSGRLRSHRQEGLDAAQKRGKYDKGLARIVF
jgi:hypothetical protein